MGTEEQILAGEFLSKLGNKKSRFIIQLVCDYLNSHPEAMDAKETVQFIVSNTSVGERLADMIKSLIKAELAGRTMINPSSNGAVKAGTVQDAPDVNDDIGDMFGNLDAWNL